MRPCRVVNGKKQGRWMLVWPVALSVVLCISKGIQLTVTNEPPGPGAVPLPAPYARLTGYDFRETTDLDCAAELYGTPAASAATGGGGGGGGGGDGGAWADTNAVDVQLNWTFDMSGDGVDVYPGTSPSYVINPSILLDQSTRTLVRAARVHRMEKAEQKGVRLTNSEYLNGTVTEITNTWVSTIVAAEAGLDAAAVAGNDIWSPTSWDPQDWGLDAKGVPMRPANLTTSRATRRPWTNLCRVKPQWIPENKTLIYKVVTGPEDPKLFRLADSNANAGGGSSVPPPASWAVLFSSMPPLDVAGPTCDGSIFAVVQMYVALGDPGLLVPPPPPPPLPPPAAPVPAPAGVRLACGKSYRAEKNWIPFVYEGQQHFVYSVAPHTVSTARPADGTCVTQWVTEAFAPVNELARTVGAGNVHGSATAELFGTRADRYLALMHTLDPNNGMYTTLAYMFDAEPPFAIRAVSRPLPLLGGGRAFPSGLVVLPGSLRVMVSYGVADAQSRSMVLSRAALRDLFTWRGCAVHDLDWWSSWDVDPATGVDLRAAAMNVSVGGAGPACAADIARDEARTVAAAQAAAAAQVCDSCEEAARAPKYCPQATTEVAYTCPEGSTPERVGLSDVAFNLVAAFFGGVAICAGVVGVGKWQDRRLAAAANDPAVQERRERARSARARKSKTGASIEWFYIATLEVDPQTGTAVIDGPVSREDMCARLLNGEVYSRQQLSSGGEANVWCCARDVAGLPRSEAAEWYSLGDDSIVEGPFRWSVLRGWYDSGAVAPDLLIVCTGVSEGDEEEDWRELHEVFAAADEEDEEDARAIAALQAEQEQKQAAEAKAIAQENAKSERKKQKAKTTTTKKKKKKKKKARMSKEDKMQAMWYVYYPESNDSLGPYPGSMLHSWLFWGDVTPETQVCLAVDDDSAEWTAVEHLFGETVLAQDEEEDAAATEEKNAAAGGGGGSGGGVGAALAAVCACCPCVVVQGPQEGDVDHDDLELVRRDSLSVASLGNVYEGGGDDGGGGVDSFRKYRHGRSKSGAMRPDWIDNEAVGWEAGGGGGGEQGLDGQQQQWNDDGEWQEHVDEESGRYFYFSERTQDTRWTPPEQGGYRPCAWRVQHDDATGRAYFANKDTGETVWQLSARAEAAASGAGEELAINPLHHQRV